MINFYWLDHIQPADRSWVGNKAFHLSHLLQKGYPVVPGFVVSAQVLHEFLETIDWPAPLFADFPHSSLHLDIDNAQQLQAIARQIRQSIQVGKLADFWVTELAAEIAKLDTSGVILRPSLAVHSEIGRYTSAHMDQVANGKSSALFNTGVCFANAQQVVETLKQIWAELFSARSLFYWQRSNIPLNQVRLAVLVQPLWSAIAAGNARTDPTLIEIESTIGLGMAISRGEITPDLHQIEISSGKVWGQKLGKKTIAYQIAVPPTQSASTALPVIDSACLSTTLVDDSEQACLVLSPENLTDLVQLLQSLILEMGTNLEIEWLLTVSSDAPPCFYLTQVFPRSLATIERLPPNFSHLPMTSLASPDAPEELLLSGLGVAGGEVIARATVIVNSDAPPASLGPGRVLVAPNIPPDWFPLTRQVAAIVTEQGGMTSHSAIIAREMRVPAVMGAEAATRRIQTGDLIRVDGVHGRIYRLPHNTPHPISDRQQTKPPIALPPPLRTIAASLTETEDCSRPLIGTQLMVNLSQPHLLLEIANLPIDGIGLLRSEMLITSHLDRRHPQDWLKQGPVDELTNRLATAVDQLASALAPRPVFYRSLDLRSHEFRGLFGGDSMPLENNPMLGRHGTFSYTVDSALFELELAALRQVQEKGLGNVHLLLPFVRTVEEFQFCQQKIQQAGLTRNPHFQTWIMAEVPSVLFLLPDFVRAGVQGISIGTNDLTQLLLAVDRDDTVMSSAFDERHPALKAAIAHLIQAATAANIPCSICGQAPVRYPELIADLIAWGITSISVEPEALEATYWAIARAERKLLLAAARH